MKDDHPRFCSDYSSMSKVEEAVKRYKAAKASLERKIENARPEAFCSLVRKFDESTKKPAARKSTQPSPKNESGRKTQPGKRAGKNKKDPCDAPASARQLSKCLVKCCDKYKR